MKKYSQKVNKRFFVFSQGVFIFHLFPSYSFRNRFRKLRIETQIKLIISQRDDKYPLSCERGETLLALVQLLCLLQYHKFVCCAQSARTAHTFGREPETFSLNALKMLIIFFFYAYKWLFAGKASYLYSRKKKVAKKREKAAKNSRITKKILSTMTLTFGIVLFFQIFANVFFPSFFDLQYAKREFQPEKFTRFLSIFIMRFFTH